MLHLEDYILMVADQAHRPFIIGHQQAMAGKGYRACQRQRAAEAADAATPPPPGQGRQHRQAQPAQPEQGQAPPGPLLGNAIYSVRSMARRHAIGRKGEPILNPIGNKARPIALCPLKGDAQKAVKVSGRQQDQQHYQGISRQPVHPKTPQRQAHPAPYHRRQE